MELTKNEPFVVGGPNKRGLSTSDTNVDCLSCFNHDFGENLKESDILGKSVR